MSEDQVLVDTLYDRFRGAVGISEVDADTIVSITTLAMVVVDRQKNMSGEDKKQLVLHLLKRLVNDTDMIDKDKDATILVINAIVPSVIDTIINATKGGFDINRVKSRWEWIKKNCCCCK